MSGANDDKGYIEHAGLRIFWDKNFPKMEDTGFAYAKKPEDCKHDGHMILTSPLTCQQCGKRMNND